MNFIGILWQKANSQYRDCDLCHGYYGDERNAYDRTDAYESAYNNSEATVVHESGAYMYISKDDGEALPAYVKIAVAIE